LADADPTLLEQIARLQRRVDRERNARREAEAIAERTTRMLYGEVEIRTRELESIVEMGRELAQSLDDRRFADRIARHIAQAVDFDECGIYTWDHEADAVVTAGYHPTARRSSLRDVYPLEEYPETRQVLVTGRQSIIDPFDPNADASEVRFMVDLGGTLMVQLPMIVNGRTIGTVELLSMQGKTLIERQVGLAQTMANEAAVMLENSRLYAQVRHQAFHDHLTALPNRALLGDRIEHALARGRRGVPPLVALLFVDVDDFKLVNDSFGHEVGDQVLVAVATRLQRLVRPGDTVARLSGDEFGILLEDLIAATDAESTAARIVEAFLQPIEVKGRAIDVSVSVGVDVGTATTTSAEDLVRNADFAMYGAKSLGKGRHRVYAAAEREAADDGARMRSELRHAVALDELRLHFQPIVDLRDGRIASFEALVRWQHARRGLLSPALFVPLAEEIGAINDIGDWVLETGCVQLAAWRRLQPELTLAVNLSGAQLHAQGLVARVAEILRRTGVPPASLTLEVTETVLVAEPAAADVLAALKHLGVHLAIDDFGTGYASISYLRRFAVDVLKIDREFTDGVETRDGAALLGGIVQLGRSLGLTVVAEGIERHGQLTRIRDAGCDLGQGFLFARPATPEDATELLRAEGGLAPGTMRWPSPPRPEQTDRPAASRAIPSPAVRS
jgi:diguanylate cyclase (GGDEF)-like protein